MAAVETEPLVSVIIPTYNRAQTLGETLQSVVSQTYPFIEIIVVDDGSTDAATARVVGQFAGRVRYLRQDNQGVELARKHGARLARGAYLNFLDDDDLMLPEKIDLQVRALRAHPEAGLAHCRYRFIDAQGRPLETTGALPQGDVRKQLVWGCFPWSGGPLLRRECLDSIGEDESRDWHGDWGMWLRIALAGYSFACVQKPLGCYRMVRGSMVDAKIDNCERLVFHILDEVFRRWTLPDDIVSEKDQICAGWRFWIACRYYLVQQWEDGIRNLQSALELRPDLLSHPERLLRLFYCDAVSPRVRIWDPIEFIEGVFDHLPAAASPIRHRKAELLSQVCTHLALRAFSDGDLGQGRRRIGEAVKANPAMIQPSEGFVRVVTEHLQTLPWTEDRSGCLERLFGNLPPEAGKLSRLRSRVCAEAHTRCAVAEYSAGRTREARSAALSALRQRPRLLRDRRLVSVLVKSLAPRWLRS
jgi:glycosyltransferase involved in cell wall biosynthesis